MCIYNFIWKKKTTIFMHVLIRVSTNYRIIDRRVFKSWWSMLIYRIIIHLLTYQTLKVKFQIFFILLSTNGTKSHATFSIYISIISNYFSGYLLTVLICPMSDQHNLTPYILFVETLSSKCHIVEWFFGLKHFGRKSFW